MNTLARYNPPSRLGRRAGAARGDLRSTTFVLPPIPREQARERVRRMSNHGSQDCVTPDKTGSRDHRTSRSRCAAGRGRRALVATWRNSTHGPTPQHSCTRNIPLDVIRRPATTKLSKRGADLASDGDRRNHFPRRDRHIGVNVHVLANATAHGRLQQPLIRADDRGGCRAGQHGDNRLNK